MLLCFTGRVFGRVYVLNSFYVMFPPIIFHMFIHCVLFRDVIFGADRTIFERSFLLVRLSRHNQQHNPCNPHLTRTTQSKHTQLPNDNRPHVLLRSRAHAHAHATHLARDTSCMRHTLRILHLACTHLACNTSCISHTLHATHLARDTHYSLSKRSR